MSKAKITTLFLDIGGVLLTNGWDRHSRAKAIEEFNLDGEEVNERHHLSFSIYEEGKLTLHEYLSRVVFYEERTFSEDEFLAFMYAQSQPFWKTIEYFQALKEQFGLKVVAVSNEGKELNKYRVAKFRLHELFDVFISSSFVHMRKPDNNIFQMAIDIAQAIPEHSLYIDDRYLFVQIAQSFGIHGVNFSNLEDVKVRLENFGLKLNDQKQKTE